MFIFYQFLSQAFLNANHIAYIAHIGGFIAGAILVFYFKRKDEVYMAEPTY